MFHGSMVALVTPMNEDTSVDWQALDELLEWHIAQGTQAIVAVGTTGESATLNMQEHMDVIRHTVKRVNGRLPVVAGTGANSTWEALELTSGAKDAGADACLLVTPYYNKPTQEGLFLHHEYIAKRVAIPQLLYNVPGRTAVDMLPETVARLSSLDHIVGIKDATADMQRLATMQTLIDNDNFVFLSGDDETAVEFINNGGSGEISVTANICPALVAEMCQLAADKELQQAFAIHERLMPLHRALFKEANPIPVKWALAHMGKIGHSIRLPLTVLSKQYQQQMIDALQHTEALA